MVAVNARHPRNEYELISTRRVPLIPSSGSTETIPPKAENRPSPRSIPSVGRRGVQTNAACRRPQVKPLRR